MLTRMSVCGITAGRCSMRVLRRCRARRSLRRRVPT